MSDIDGETAMMEVTRRNEIAFLLDLHDTIVSTEPPPTMGMDVHQTILRAASMLVRANNGARIAADEAHVQLEKRLAERAPSLSELEEYLHTLGREGVNKR
ncbi:hypothetical protein A2851_01250 [Candidatus Kaiserbacteria bacterium RIFCSPHIGHO2_01_FULL_53_29]|uniref:Uncharacterized protein n=1 Tax=Candidatus Kaiserbacteria bacterium RIFCSPHIGHO2_01_FULL_53_29 TaxID=1798480 RepID=A0A1F6CXC9_9BACT|nr:MAG: hypothetical protein A2851_01250 [Candidatus Kaiserbacteria bacterium RIFCSPHIGHO2_01_FULL_53_29]